MLLAKIATVLSFVLGPFCHAIASSKSFDNALALIESQSDLTLFARLVRRDPELVKLYSSAKDVTIVAAVDSPFPDAETSAIIYSNKAYIRGVLQDTVIEGQYPTKAITTSPIYANTKLSNPRFVNTLRGRAVAKLIERDGKKTVDIGVGNSANITQGDLRFKNGILHKVSNPLSPPESFFTTGARLDISAISKIPAPFVGIFEAVTGQQDTTLFSITNEAFEAAMAANPNATLPDFVRDLAYTVVAGGVYFENAFTGRSVKALNGVELRLSGFGTGTIKVNNARVVRSDVFTSNGVLHILDRPLFPLQD